MIRLLFQSNYEIRHSFKGLNIELLKLWRHYGSLASSQHVFGHVAHKENRSMNDKFTMDVDQAHEIKHAAKRNGVTNADLKALTNGDTFAHILPFLRGLADIVMKPILELVNEKITVSARKKFVVADHFKKGNAGIYFIDGHFKMWFGELVEESVPGATLSSRKLMRSADDESIRAELGDGHETFLAWLFEKLKQQADRYEGDFLLNTRANIWYIRDVNGVVRAVDAHHNGNGWYVSAKDVSNPNELGGWGDGRQVFSRNLYAVA